MSVLSLRNFKRTWLQDVLQARVVVAGSTTLHAVHNVALLKQELDLGWATGCGFNWAVLI
jgi:hypothetical protein